MLSVRPRIAELSFQVFGRSLHPELFQIQATRIVANSCYRAKLDITTSGHVISWSTPDCTITEVACSAQHPLPDRRRIVNKQLKAAGEESFELPGGFEYRCRYQLETVKPAVFASIQEAIAMRGDPDGLYFAFNSSGRMHLGGASYVSVESRLSSLSVNVFHSFPDDHAIVRTESVFSKKSS